MMALAPEYLGLSRRFSRAYSLSRCPSPKSRQVVVRTSDVRGAGTDADVFLTVYGPKGDTGERELAASGNNFERNKVCSRTV